MSEERHSEGTVSVQRYIRFKLASPSPEKTSGSDTESIHSCQGYETEFVKDTSDTSSSPTHFVEYDITDTEEQKGYVYSQDDTDDLEDVVKLDTNFKLSEEKNDVDNALLGDTSEENSTSPTSNSDVDPGLPRNDYLDFEKCVLCQTDQKDVSYPYCNTCFKWKKNLFPSRPRKRQKLLKKNSQITYLSKKSDLLNVQSRTKNDNNNVDKKSGERKGNFSEDLLEDSGVGSSEQQISEDVVDGLSQDPSTSQSSQSTSSSTGMMGNMCRVCFLRPESGLFVHLNVAHVYGCYSCAKKIWYNTGSCPICRRKIFKVAKLFF